MSYDPRKISGMPPGKPLEGDEWIEVLQDGLEDGRNVRVQVKEMKGEKGDPGVNAYDLARTEGFVGSLSEWLEYIHGRDGSKGDPGTEGLSAYEVAVAEGFDGSVTEWLISIRGKNAFQHAMDKGFIGTLDQWLESLHGEQGVKGEKGDRGKSAYEVALETGFDDTIDAWLASLKGGKGVKGDTGQDGRSAYEIAVQEQGYSGTITEWLQSLRGPRGFTGMDAYQVAVDEGYPGNRLDWLKSLEGEKGDPGVDGVSGTDGRDGELLIIADGEQTSTPVRELEVTGANVTVSGERATLKIAATQTDAASTMPRAVKRTLTNNGYGCRVNMVALGTQEDLDAVTVTVEGGKIIKVNNVASSCFLQSITVSYDAGFNATTEFGLEYPDPFGDTDETDMNVPVMFQYSQTNPSVMQPPMQQNYRNDFGRVTMSKVGLVENTAWRWKLILV